MNKQIEIIRKTRNYLLELIKDLSIEELNTVPAGFNNNIIWNLGHLIAAQQGVCYKRAGLDTVVEPAFFDAYKSGSRPGDGVDAAGAEEIKQLLGSSLDILEADYAGGRFNTYPAWASRYGVELANIEDAINFLQFHEGLHSGYIMALKRVVN